MGMMSGDWYIFVFDVHCPVGISPVFRVPLKSFPLPGYDANVITSIELPIWRDCLVIPGVDCFIFMNVTDGKTRIVKTQEPLPRLNALFLRGNRLIAIFHKRALWHDSPLWSLSIWTMDGVKEKEFAAPDGVTSTAAYSSTGEIYWPCGNSVEVYV